MFRMADFHKIEMTLEEAKNTLCRLTPIQGLLEGMTYMNEQWDNYQETYDSPTAEFMDDYEFYDCWQYECSAYNKVFEYMSPLFEMKGEK